MVLQARNFSRPKRLRVATVSLQNSAPSSISAGSSGKTVTQTSSLISAARRRRARTNGTVNGPRYAVSDAKQRHLTATSTKTNRASKSKKVNAPEEINIPVPDIEMQDVEHETSNTDIQTKTVQLPRHLHRPPSSFKDIDVTTLVEIDPELSGVDVGFVKDGLAELGPGMLRVLTSVVANSTRDALPKELSVLVRDLSSDMPTHMLAIYGAASTSGASTSKQPKRRVTLYAVHSIVLSVLCANLPKGLFSRRDSSSSASEEEKFTEDAEQRRVTLPVVGLCIPDPTSFATLAAYLYTRHEPTLVRALLPAVQSADNTSSIPSSILGRENNSEGEDVLYELDSDSDEDDIDSENSLDSISTSKVFTKSPSKQERLACQVYVSQLSNLPTTALLTHAMMVHGLYRNASVLQVSEHGLWTAISRCWDVLVDAMEEQILRDKINRQPQC